MFFGRELTGIDLPERTLCLTFDDGPGSTAGFGPGPRTVELAQFLADRGIPATFFVIGAFAEAQLRLVEQVSRMGHLIANHTFNHPALAGESGTFAADEIRETERVLAGIYQPIKLFRPPYGSWDSEVAGQLNWTDAWRHIGPINWDIDAGDWWFWKNGLSAKECASAYIDLIHSVGKGVVLMHDSSFEEEIRAQSFTFEAAQLLVNSLTADGYTFTRLDSIPQIAEARQISSIIALQAASGHFISPQHGGNGLVLADGPSVGAWEPLGIMELGGDNIALRCLSGHYISPQNGGGGEVLANGPAIGPWEKLTRVNLLGNGSIAIRCPSGHYLSAQNGGGGALLANGPAVAEWEPFRVVVPSGHS